MLTHPNCNSRPSCISETCILYALTNQSYMEEHLSDFGISSLLYPFLLPSSSASAIARHLSHIQRRHTYLPAGRTSLFLVLLHSFHFTARYTKNNKTVVIPRQDYPSPAHLPDVATDFAPRSAGLSGSSPTFNQTGIFDFLHAHLYDSSYPPGSSVFIPRPDTMKVAFASLCALALAAVASAHTTIWSVVSLPSTRMCTHRWSFLFL